MGEGLLHKKEMGFPTQKPDLWGPFLYQSHHPTPPCAPERQRDWQPAFAICSGPSLRIHNTKQTPQLTPHKHLVDHMRWERRAYAPCPINPTPELGLLPEKTPGRAMGCSPRPRPRAAGKVWNRNFLCHRGREVKGVLEPWALRVLGLEDAWRFYIPFW